MDIHHAKAVASNMVFIVWGRETTARAYGRAGELIKELGEQFQEGIGVLQTVEEGAVPPDAAARSEFLRVLRESEKHVKHYSVLHEGSGFKAASVRAIMASVYMYTRPQFAHRLFSSLNEAAAWHSLRQREIGHQDTPQQIVNIVHTLRKRIAELGP